MDKYDEAIERILTLDEDKIIDIWQEPLSDPAGCLFYHCAPEQKESAHEHVRPDGKQVGCLTQVKGNRYYVAWTNELTELIRSNPLIPENENFLYLLERKDLEEFAKLQRLMDQTIRGNYG